MWSLSAACVGRSILGPPPACRATACGTSAGRRPDRPPTEQRGGRHHPPEGAEALIAVSASMSPPCLECPTPGDRHATPSPRGPIVTHGSHGHGRRRTTGREADGGVSVGGETPRESRLTLRGSFDRLFVAIASRPSRERRNSDPPALRRLRDPLGAPAQRGQRRGVPSAEEDPLIGVREA